MLISLKRKKEKKKGGKKERKKATVQSAFHDTPLWKDFLLSSRGREGVEAIQTTGEEKVARNSEKCHTCRAAGCRQRNTPTSTLLFFYSPSLSLSLSLSLSRRLQNLAWSAYPAPVPSAISSQINQTFESRSTQPPHPAPHHSASANPATGRKLCNRPPLSRV